MKFLPSPLFRLLGIFSASAVMHLSAGCALSAIMSRALNRPESESIFAACALTAFGSLAPLCHRTSSGNTKPPSDDGGFLYTSIFRASAQRRTQGL